MVATVCLWLNARVMLLMIITNAGGSNKFSAEKRCRYLIELHAGENACYHCDEWKRMSCISFTAILPISTAFIIN